MFYYGCTIYTSTYNFECINFHIMVLFVRTCGVEIAVVRHGMKISTVGCKLRNHYFSTWPKRQDYRFTRPHTCNLLSHKRKENRTKWHTTPLQCLSLLRFQCYFMLCRWNLTDGWEWTFKPRSAHVKVEMVKAHLAVVLLVIHILFSIHFLFIPWLPCFYALFYLAFLFTWPMNFNPRKNHYILKWTGSKSFFIVCI